MRIVVNCSCNCFVIKSIYKYQEFEKNCEICRLYNLMTENKHEILSATNSRFPARRGGG